MTSLITGYEYDIFISYRQKDNKHDGWVTNFVENLKGELEATFKEDVSVYFDENPHDRLQETYNVDKSLEGKLKCLILIPILSQTYCDPASYAWQKELLSFIEITEDDRFGKDVKLRSGNVANRILPVRIHDLEPEDISLFEKETGSVLRSIDFIYKTASGVNRPLLPEDNKNDNLNKTLYRDQVNKVAGAIKEIIFSLTRDAEHIVREKPIKPEQEGYKPKSKAQYKKTAIIPGNRKNLLHAVLFFLIIIGTVSVFSVINHHNNARELANPDKSIAVLPFVNDSPDKENEYFCNGMMEDILNNLVKIKELEVKSRTDVEAYRGVVKSRKDIAKELGVSYLLEGSVRKQGNSFRLMVQLIDAKTGFHKWSQPYEGEALEIFTVQAQVAKKVADELKVVLTSDEKKSIEKIPTTNIEAYEYYTMSKVPGMQYWRPHDSRDLMESINYLNKALEIDPNFEDALSLKGTIYASLYQYDSAWVCARRLLEINPESLNAYSLLSSYYTYSNDPLPALENRKELLRYSDKRDTAAIKINEINIGAIYCWYLNDYKEGFAHIQKAVDSTSMLFWMYLAATFGAIGDFERAEKYCKNAIEVDYAPIATYAYSTLLAMQSKFDEALMILDKYCKPGTEDIFCMRGRFYNHILKDDFNRASVDLKALNNLKDQMLTEDSVFIAYLYKNTGGESEASGIIQNCLRSYDKKSLKDKGSAPFLFRSFLYGMKGEKQRSLEQLSKAYDLGISFGFYNYPAIVPFYGDIGNDPEFKALVKKARENAAKSKAVVDEMRRRGEIDL